MQIRFCKCSQFARGETGLQNVAGQPVTGVAIVAKLALFSLCYVLLDDVPDGQMVCLDTCNRVSAAPRDDLSSFGRGLVKRKTMHVISVDEVIGACDNFLTIARSCSPPDQPPAAANAPSIAEMHIRIE